jgi:hypothetical protein
VRAGPFQFRQPSLLTSALKFAGRREAAPSSGMLQAGQGMPAPPQSQPLRAFPWPAGMVLTIPSSIGAQDAFHPSHQAQREHELRTVERVMSIDEVL